MSGETDLLPGVTGAMGGHSAWLQGLRSPLIKEVHYYIIVTVFKRNAMLCDNRARMAAHRS